MTQTRHRADHELEAAIIDELARTPSVDAREISVTDSAATLSGKVGTYPELEEALRAATRVHGVTVTAGEIVFDRRTVVVPTGSVRVEVTDHVITVRGTVDWQFQREAAWFAAGVTAVDNQVTLSG